jgi:hypothetical protein
VRELHEQGKSRNDISRETGIASGTVSSICRTLGLTFDREQVKAATAAKQADSKARRALLAANLLTDAERLRERLWEESVQLMSTPTGPARATLDLPPARDVNDFVRAVSGAVKSHIDLERHDADTGTEGARSVLGALGEALQVAAARIDGEVTEP